MADCTGVATLDDAKNFKLDAGSASEFVSSPDPALTTRLNTVQRTVTGINEDINEAIAALGGVDVGVYNTNPILNTLNDYTVDTNTTQAWRLKTNTGTPYQTDSATYPDPNNDPNLRLWQPDVTKDYVNQQVSDGDSQVVGGVIFPETTDASAVDGDALVLPTTLLRVDEVLYFIVKTNGDRQEFTGTISNLNTAVAPYSVTIGADACYLLIEKHTDYFNKSLNFKALGALPDNATDINPVILAFDNMSEWLCTLESGDDFFNSQTWTPTRVISAIGPDTKDGPDTATIRTPDGVSGYSGESGTQGSRLEGFQLKVTSSRATGGAIVDFNAAQGKLLFARGLTERPVGNYDIRGARTLDTLNGVLSFAGNEYTPTSSLSVSIYDTSPTPFTITEPVTAAPSGASGNITFTSEKYAGVLIDNLSGTFAPGDVLTGTISGSTAKIHEITSVGTRHRVADATVLSGSILVDDGSGFSQEVFILSGTFCYGIVTTQRMYIENMVLRAFGGDGILIATTDGYVGNANLTEARQVRCVNVGGNGLRLIGGDSNAGEFSSCSFVQCFGFPVVERSFLGNKHTMHHSSGTLSGGYNSQISAARSVSFDTCYQEGTGVVDQPWPLARSTISGLNISIGGTPGVPTVSERQNTSADAGIRITSYGTESLYDFTQQGTRSIRPKTLDGSALRLMSRGSAPRESVLEGAIGETLSQGPNTIEASFEFTRDISGDTGGTARYSYRAFELRNRVRGGKAVVSGAGSNSMLVPTTDGNGVIIKIDVRCGGKDHVEGVTTIGFNGPGVGGIFTPVIQDGVIVHVYVENGGTGYFESDFSEPLRLETLNGQLAVNPGIDNAVNFGNGTFRIKGGAIVTDWTVGSDVNIKKDFTAIPQELCDFALSEPFQMYRLKDNDSNRFHAGIIITPEFIAGLDAVFPIADCAAICRDIFKNEDGEPITRLVGSVELGELWQVRYHEWNCIFNEGLRRRELISSAWVRKLEVMYPNEAAEIAIELDSEV